MLSPDQLLNDRYLLTQCLSEKTGRQTWKAIDRQTDQTVVLKVLLFGTGVQWQEIKLFEREAQLLRSLDLPQIPRYLDDFELNLPDVQGFVLVQTYLDARSLEFYLEAGYSFTPADVKEIAEQLLRLLVELHNRTVPIIHRDIKPSNLLLSNRSAHSVGQLYLVDFGSAMTHELSGKGTVTIVGTFGYIPPEQFIGKTVPASDLYSLGVTLISLLTGMSDDALPHTPGQMDLESLADVEFGLVRWLRKLTEPTIERRFCSAQEALRALRNLDAIESDVLNRRKPANSKIILQKSIDQFSVRFLPDWNVLWYDLGRIVVPGLLSILSLLILLIIMISSLSLWSFGYSVFSILLVLVLLFIILLSFTTLIFPYFVRFRLSITSTKIQFTEHFMGICINSQSYLRKDILKLERVNPRFVSPKQSNSNPFQLKPEIVIWIGTRASRLLVPTVPELDWLAQELSDWLEMPIEHRDFPETTKL